MNLYRRSVTMMSCRLDRDRDGHGDDPKMGSSPQPTKDQLLVKDGVLMMYKVGWFGSTTTP